MVKKYALTGIRNYVHDQFNVHTPFYFASYAKYLKSLKDIGVNEIEHAGSNIKFTTQRERLKNAVEEIHNSGMRAYLYTGVFGSENLNHHRKLESFAQRDKHGNVLSYSGKSLKTAMMCPASGYTENVITPRLLDRIQLARFDGLFCDIPWIMKSGCYCDNCKTQKEEGADNAMIVRNALIKIVSALKKENPSISICINAAAPTIHDNSLSGGHIDNLIGIFDEYLTEWNPYRWNQNVSIVSRCIEYAGKTVNGRLVNATTLTTRQGEMYTSDQYMKLFSSILQGGATPRLGVRFPSEQLRIIGYAWRKAMDL